MARSLHPPVLKRRKPQRVTRVALERFVNAMHKRELEDNDEEDCSGEGVISACDELRRQFGLKTPKTLLPWWAK